MIVNVFCALPPTLVHCCFCEAKRHNKGQTDSNPRSVSFAEHLSVEDGTPFALVDTHTRMATFSTKILLCVMGAALRIQTPQK